MAYDLGKHFLGQSKNSYFAAKDAKETAEVILGKSVAWFQQLESNQYLEKIKQCWAQYHGAFYTDTGSGHQVIFAGEQGELSMIAINHFRNLAQHILTMVTATRPALQARSTNTDYKSLIQTKLANGLLDYYMREKRLEKQLKTAVEYALVMAAGYIKMEWNSTSGEIYDFNEETQSNIYEGDIDIINLSPFDVVFDSTKEYGKNDWIMCRSFKNKFDFAAKYPEFKAEIENLPTKSDVQRYRFDLQQYEDTDDIPIYEFFHNRTESMPDGRYMLFISPTIILLDTPMPYRAIPVYRIAPAEILGTPYGYTPLFDLMPIQDAINSLHSTILSNQNAFGVQNVFVPRGSELSVNQLVGGLNVIEGNSKPEPLNLTSTPPEIFKYLEMLEREAETISGVNSVARGNPEASLKSGTALALVQSQALQFVSGLQQSYIQLIEDVGTGLINMLKDFASVPRVAAIAGKANRTVMKEFSGDDLSTVNRVIVDVGNALSKCLKKDTEILMFDGSIKKVQDIIIGDLIMGPDSKIRTVESISSGEEKMYDIHHKTKKDKFLYGCNESHILTLKYCSDDNRYGLKQYDIIDISVKEFLGLPERQQRLFMGFRTGVDFPKKEISFPAYELGLWLGDGHQDRLTLTTIDQEIFDSWLNVTKTLGFNNYIYEQSETVRQIGFAKTDGKCHKHLLTELNLYKNKHIPEIYKFNNKQIRFELLAGLIDTDGSQKDGTYVISQTNNKLANDIEYLIRSLGLKVSRRKIKTSCMYKGEKIIGTTNSLIIGGNTWEIPCRLPRKQVKKYTKVKDSLNYGIRIKDIGIGTYYGFTLKEESHFLLGDFTVTHNTTAGKLQIAESLLQMGLIKTPEQYFSVLNTGELDLLTDNVQNELFLIKDENEKLMEGDEDIHAIATDDHVMHIKEHKAVLSDADLRKDPELVTRTLNHIQQHIDLMRSTDPDLLQIIGVKPLGPQQGSSVGSNFSDGGQKPPASALGKIPEATGLSEATSVQSSPQGANVNIPKPATPPEPFKNLPMTPEQMMSQNSQGQ